MSVKTLRCGLIVLVALAAVGAVLPRVVAAGPSFHGSVSDRYRFRSTGGFSDHDMEALLTLDIGSFPSDRFSGALQIGGIFDLNGNQSADPFSGIYDTFSKGAAARFYYAYADIKDLGFLSNIRAGRQHQYDIEGLYYDGLTLETDSFYHLVLRAFAGVPVHLFENQVGDDSGDWMAGSSLEWNPVAKFLARFDFVHLKDSVTAFRSGVGDQEDNLLAANLWWDLSQKIHLSSRFTTFTDQVRDLSANATYSLDEKNLSFYGRVYRLLTGYDVRVIEWDVYRIAGTYQPYTEFSLGATKGFGPHFAVDTGAGFRMLDNDQAGSAFNHGYWRLYNSLSSMEWPIKGMNLSATADYYNGRDNTLDNNTFGLSFDAEQSLFSKKMKIKGGTAYYLYRYNFLAGNESDNVRTYYAGLEGKVFKDINGSVQYELEDNRFNVFHTAKFQLKWSF